uniref:2-hydroxychromene-2-carboxylate isomerase n=1 Tax=Rhodopseudomonas palustris (strain BisA53) TaxID=316055 RepID=Q07H84_RHOP5
MSQPIDYYFSLQSPWAYIGHEIFRELVSAYDLKVNYKPVVLIELFEETGGMPLGKRHPVRQHYRLVELQRWRAKRGLDFHLQPKHWPFNAKLADSVVIAAVESGLDPDSYLRQAYPAMWERQLDLADPQVLVTLADAAGLPGTSLVERAASAGIGEIYQQNRQHALDAGVFGSPAYVLNGEVFWGQDRLDLLDDALKSGRPPFRPPS